MNDLLERLASRKFLLAVVGAGLFFANDYFQLQLDAETMNNITAVIVGYILAEGGIDALRELKARR